MKKLYFIFMLLICFALTSCTDTVRAKQYGGTMTINLPKGEKLIEATWKQADIWYLTEPMEADYKPKTKIFREESNYGIMQGKVIFVESK